MRIPSRGEILIVIHKFVKARHSGMDCRNPGYMDVFKFAIPGTGYPLPGGYDELRTYLCITMSAPVWEQCSFENDDKLIFE